MPSKSLAKTAALNIRIKANQRQLIERAAQETDQTVSDFVRDAAVRKAQQALLARTTFHVDEETWERFTAALDAPTKNNPRLWELMSRDTVWKA